MAEQDGPRVLVIDDEENIRFLVESGLQLAGMQTLGAEDGRAGLKAAKEFRPDVIVLDVMMPKLNGFEVVKRLRDAGSKTPIIFLSARDATDDRVRGLTTGGDDYMIKPFAIAELVARVQLRLQQAGIASRETLLRCAELELDITAHRVTAAGSVVELTPTEYKLLQYLLENSGQVLSRSQLLNHVWEYDFDGNSAVVDTYISYLRKKLGPTGSSLIHTIRGIGFSLRVKE